MSKIIFLDIDGVLNSVRSAIALGFEWPFSDEEKSLDPIAVKLLKRLCEETGAGIVISSTWRQGRNNQNFVDIFAHYGWENFPIIGMTPKLNTIRGYEIQGWMDEYNAFTIDPITGYVIIDDSSDMLPEQAANFVHVNLEDGMSLRDYVTSLKILDPDHADLSPMGLGGYL